MNPDYNVLNFRIYCLGRK